MAGIDLSLEEKEISEIVRAIRELAQGRSNAGGLVTLRANQTTTVVGAINCSKDSKVFLTPRTANAAAAVPTTYILATNMIQGGFTITHASAVSLDRTFGWVAFG